MSDEDSPLRIDSITVPPGAIARMAASGARPSPALREAIDRARQRRGGRIEAMSTGLTVEQFLASVLDVRTRFPRARLVKNEVGNLAILNEGGRYIGYVNLRTGDVELTS